nr:hypothetical protein [Tanacetum cinerariifolium]
MGLLDLLSPRTLSRERLFLMPPLKKVRTYGVKISELVSTTAGKSPAALRRLELQSRVDGSEYGSAMHPSKEFVSSSITPTPEPDDPLPLDDAVDLPCVEFLNENRTLIRKYSKIFLCIVVLSHLYTETDVRPNFLYNDDEGTHAFGDLEVAFEHIAYEFPFLHGFRMAILEFAGGIEDSTCWTEGLGDFTCSVG